MYYGPRGNKIHSWLIKKKSSHRYIGTFLFLTVLVIAWVIFLYQPLNCIITLEKQKAIALKEQYNNGVEAQKVCKQLESKIQGSRDIVVRSSDAQEERESDYLSFLLNHAEQAGLKCCSCSRSSEKEYDGLFQYEVTCKMNGSLKQAIQFFDQLVKSTNNFGCSQVFFNHVHADEFNISCVFTYVLATQ